jgi:hypothetical protein
VQIGRRAARYGLVSLAVFAGATGVAFATQALTTRATATATIQACQLNKVGTLRIVDSAAECNVKFEKAISWNVQGPKGDTGAAGAAGAAGAKGATGAAGAAGPAGAKGDTGAAGAAGGKGDAGPAGDKGDPGSGFTWRGPYQDRVVYNPGDVVSAGGSTWITNEGIGSGDIAPPDDPWQLLAAKGDAGAFTGSLQSPNGQYSLALTNTGAVLTGPGGTVKIGSTSIDVVGSGGGAVHVTPFGTAVQGTQVSLNGCNAPVARVGDSISGVMSGSLGTKVLTAGFNFDEPHRQVLPWDGLYVPNGGNPLPVISSFDTVNVPLMAAKVTIVIPGVSTDGTVTGAVAAGSPTVCAG